MATYATTFSEYVDLIATNSPHAAILDWWRRLDRAIDHYYQHETRRRPKKAVEVERDIALDPNLGDDAAILLRQLRQDRNHVAHREIPVTREQAVDYARHAHLFAWALVTRSNLAEPKLLPVA